MCTEEGNMCLELDWGEFGGEYVLETSLCKIAMLRLVYILISV